MYKETKSSKFVKWFLIGISIIFVVLMLLLPLITVITEAFKQGFAVYEKAVTDNYTGDVTTTEWKQLEWQAELPDGSSQNTTKTTATKASDHIATTRPSL